MDDTETKQRPDSATTIDTPTGPEAYLLVVFPPAQQKVCAITSSPLTIGRALATAQADLTLDDTRLSRRHAVLTRGAASWQIADQKSVNSSFLNGRALRPEEPKPLADGAVLRLADTLCVFRTARPGDFGDFGAGEQAAFPGVSPAAVAVRRRLRRLAQASGHVLIVGETGTGKERASRSIGGPDRPFVPVNCAELTRGVARAELFGYVPGAFTGADVKKAGLVKEAHDGVLFLDEIGELPLDVQGDLLRFLEDGSYRPIGATKVECSQVRVVAATNVDLEDAVRAGKFRRDLLARLRAHNTMVELPPLHERREDILGWAAYFAREAGGRAEDLWTVGAAECLLLYPWSDNLRELRGVVRALLAGDLPEPFGRAQLPDALQNHCSELRATTPATPSKGPKRLDDPTKAEIEEVLRETKGVVVVTAKLLGIDRRHLYRLCERYEITIEHFRLK